MASFPADHALSIKRDRLVLAAWIVVRMSMD
jgi:hypothetical protein